MIRKNEVIKGIVFMAIGGCAAKAIHMVKKHKQQKDSDEKVLELAYENEQ